MYRAPTHSSGGHIPDPVIDAEIRAWMDQFEPAYREMVAEEERAERLIAAMADHDDGLDTYEPAEIRDRQARYDRDPNEAYHDPNRVPSIEGMVGL